MSLLKPALAGTAHLKVGLYGFQGSGKTRTAVEIAIGMCKLRKKMKLAFFDTEKGSDFLVKRCKDEGVAMETVKSRSFSDLMSTMKEAEAGGYGFLIIDSITHVWKNLTSAYMAKAGRKRLTFGDWGVLKTEWEQFTLFYLNSSLDIAMLGRAGYEYLDDEDEDGAKKSVKSGTKMKTEGETGFEPDLLLEMERITNSGAAIAARKSKQGVQTIINRCVVVKDRNGVMNGTIIDFPKFEHFKPIVDLLNIGGLHQGIETPRNTENLFEDPDYSSYERKKQVDICLEKVKDAFLLAGMGGTAEAARKAQAEILIETFGTSSWTEISNMRLEALQQGLPILEDRIRARAKAQLVAEEEAKARAEEARKLKEEEAARKEEEKRLAAEAKAAEKAAGTGKKSKPAPEPEAAAA